MDLEKLRNLIEIKKKSYAEASKILNIPKPTIAWNVKRHGIKNCYTTIKLEKEKLIELYCEKKLSIKNVAKLLQVSHSIVYKWLQYFEIDIRPKGHNQHALVNYEDVKKEFQRNGHTLLSDNYINSSKKLEYICRCGNKSSMTYIVCKRGTGCIKCGKEKVASIQMESFESIKEFVESKKCILLELFSQNGKSRIKYICHCGSHHEMYMSNFKKGYPCKECKRRKFQGKNNHNFNPNLTEEDRLELGRYEEGYKVWRIKVYRKANFRCDLCEKYGDNDLTAHHLESYSDNPDLRTDVNNGVCLCLKCHKEFHSSYGYGNNTKKQYDEFKIKKIEVASGCKLV